MGGGGKELRILNKCLLWPKVLFCETLHSNMEDGFYVFGLNFFWNRHKMRTGIEESQGVRLLRSKIKNVHREGSVVTALFKRLPVVLKRLI